MSALEELVALTATADAAVAEAKRAKEAYVASVQRMRDAVHALREAVARAHTA